MNLLKRIFRKKRSDADMLVSTLDSMVFVLIHGKDLDRWLTKLMYQKLRNEMLNGRISNAELKMKILHERTSKEMEKRIQGATPPHRM